MVWGLRGMKEAGPSAAMDSFSIEAGTVGDMMKQTQPVDSSKIELGFCILVSSLSRWERKERQKI
jgi:trimethylamine:corrinoid methyltransferase-like protein